MHTWSFLYQYAIGGAFFAICAWLLVRAKAIDLATPGGRRALALLVFGLLAFAGGHAFSIFLLPRL